MNKGVVSTIALVLVVVGGLNWGLVGFFEWNLVDELFGEGSGLARTVYALVGLSAVYVLFASVLKGGDKSEV